MKISDTLSRLGKQIQFILEVDKLKDVFRQSYILSENRKENSAEHSWHVAVMAIVLMEHAEEPLDGILVLKMLVLHDVIEIDAGDSYFFDDHARADQAERENKGAQRLFSLLPSDQTDALRKIWNEFEAAVSAEARFAKSMDRLMPLLHNYHTRGRSWKEHGITSKMVVSRLEKDLIRGPKVFWEYARSLIADAVRQGYLAPG